MTLTEAEEYAKKHWKAVTLCGECKYKMPNYHGGYRCGRGNRHRGWKEDWYCADGERRLFVPMH